MLSFIVRLLGSVALVVLVCCAWPDRAAATVFRDRAAFNAASQNLTTIDFQSVQPNVDTVPAIDGVVFNSIGASGIVVEPNGNKLMVGQSVGEITRVTISLPPGTTAVGCDQFGAPMIVAISTGESVMMDQSDPSTFAGFISDQPIQTLTIFLDFPEPTPQARIDNISFGQRRPGNEPPVPQLLVTSGGRAVALDSVTTESETFHVLSTHNLASDGHTRITLFIVGVALEPADLPFVTVQAEDQQQRVFDLPCEATARVKNLGWMSQVTARVPDALAGAGDVNIHVTVRGKVTNKAPLRIE